MIATVCPDPSSPEARRWRRFGIRAPVALDELIGLIEADDGLHRRRELAGNREISHRRAQRLPLYLKNTELRAKRGLRLRQRAFDVDVVVVLWNVGDVQTLALQPVFDFGRVGGGRREAAAELIRCEVLTIRAALGIADGLGERYRAIRIRPTQIDRTSEVAS
jgi:hypothetical protein